MYDDGVVDDVTRYTGETHRRRGGGVVVIF